MVSSRSLNSERRGASALRRFLLPRDCTPDLKKTPAGLLTQAGVFWFMGVEPAYISKYPRTVVYPILCIIQYLLSCNSKRKVIMLNGYWYRNSFLI